METVFVEQFLDHFQRFINLCQLENWPNDETTDEQIKNAFNYCQHIEKCRDKLTKKNIINEFMSALINKLNLSKLLIKNCVADPPRYLLKKIITSPVSIEKMDISFTIFIDIFSEEKLEDSLSEIMLEVASKDVLLKNVSSELPKSTQLEFKSHLLLSKLGCNDETVLVIDELLKDCKQDVIDMLIICLLNKNPKYRDAVTVIVNGFKTVMSKHSVVYKKFWKQLFRTSEEKFIQMCLIHNDIFTFICKALIDCGKLIEQSMSLEYFYVDLTYSELSTNVQKICKNGHLKLVFLDLIYQSNVSLDFWEREIQSC